MSSMVESLCGLQKIVHQMLYFCSSRTTAAWWRTEPTSNAVIICAASTDQHDHKLDLFKDTVAIWSAVFTRKEWLISVYNKNTTKVFLICRKIFYKPLQHTKIKSKQKSVWQLKPAVIDLVYVKKKYINKLNFWWAFFF